MRGPHACFQGVGCDRIAFERQKTGGQSLRLRLQFGLEEAQHRDLAEVLNCHAMLRSSIVSNCPEPRQPTARPCQGSTANVAADSALPIVAGTASVSRSR